MTRWAAMKRIPPEPPIILLTGFGLFYEVREFPDIDVLASKLVRILGSVETFAYYLEAKYKITPQLFAALRWNQQLYGEIRNSEGGSVRWGNDLWRIDA